MTVGQRQSRYLVVRAPPTGAGAVPALDVGSCDDRRRIRHPPPPHEQPSSPWRGHGIAPEADSRAEIKGEPRTPPRWCPSLHRPEGFSRLSGPPPRGRLVRRTSSDLLCFRVAFSVRTNSRRYGCAPLTYTVRLLGNPPGEQPSRLRIIELVAGGIPVRIDVGQRSGRLSGRRVQVPLAPSGILGLLLLGWRCRLGARVAGPVGRVVGMVFVGRRSRPLDENTSANRP